MNSAVAVGSLLDEQRKINEELMGQMREMQMQMKMMSSSINNHSASNSNCGSCTHNQSQGGSASPSGMSNFMNGMGGMRGGSPPNMGMTRNSGMNMNGMNGMKGPGLDGIVGFGNMGSGYGDNYGGGKMGGFASGSAMGMSGARSMPYNMRVPKEPGDWDCPDCGNMNFARRVKCNGRGGNCAIDKQPEFIRRGVEPKGGVNRRPGDWDCGGCGNLNYARREQCNKCKGDKVLVSSSEQSMVKPGGDWYCPKCNNMNYARRTACNRRECDFERKDLNDFGSRMGMGGMAMNGGAAAAGNGGMGGNFGGGMQAVARGQLPINVGMSGGPIRTQGSAMAARMSRRRTGPEPRPGDWECPRCYNLNFSSRAFCNGTKSGEPCQLRKPQFEKYNVAMVKNVMGMAAKDGDWDCWNCGNLNFSSRSSCNKCKEEKEEAQSDTLRNVGGRASSVKDEESE